MGWFTKSKSQELPRHTKSKSKFREYAEAIFTAVIIAFFIRSFVIEAFKIPSGSMIPTLVVGDHIFVNKFIYGLRLPLTRHPLVEFRHPQRGDVIIFLTPEDKSKPVLFQRDFIKRVIGLPGDTIEIEGTDIIINGKKVEKKKIALLLDDSNPDFLVAKLPSGVTKRLPYFPYWQYYEAYLEELGNSQYIVLYMPQLYHQYQKFEVPAGHVFVMGDNRDNSSDSRVWGYVPFEKIKGKAMFVWLSIDKRPGLKLRLSRFGHWIR